MELGIKDTATAVLSGGKKVCAFICLLGRKLTGCGTAGISSRKQYLVSIQETRTSMDTNAESHWGLAPCWEAVTNCRGAWCFKNWNWITMGRPNTTGQIQHPRTWMSPSQPQGTHHGTVAAWPYEPDGYNSSTASQAIGSLLLCQGVEGLVGLCYIYIVLQLVHSGWTWWARKSCAIWPTPRMLCPQRQQGSFNFLKLFFCCHWYK